MKPCRTSKDLLVALSGVLLLVAMAVGRGWTPASVHSERLGVPLRLAYFPNLTHAPALIGLAHHTFTQELPGYVMSTKVMNAGPEAMEALMAGEIDAAYVGPSPATNTFIKSHGEALRIVAGACSGGVSLVCRADERLAGVADLDGRTVSVPQLGGTQDVSCRRFLALIQLHPQDSGGSVTILPVINADVLTAFRHRQVDAAWIPEPWASRLQFEAGAHLVVDERSLWPGGRFTTTVLVVRRAFALAHPDAVRGLVRAQVETVDWIRAHEVEASRLANTELGRLTGKTLGDALLATAWSRMDFTTDANPGAIVAFANAAYAAHYLRARPSNLPGMFDLGPLAMVEGGR